MLLFLTANIFAQRYEIMLPYHDNGKWGYMTKSKEVVVEPMFEEAYPSTFPNRFRVKHNGKYGFIDREGQVVIKTIYDKASDFKEDKAKVTLDGSSFDIFIDEEKDRSFYGDCGSHVGYTCFDNTARLEQSAYEIVDIDGKLSTIYKYKPKLVKSEYNNSTYDRDEKGKVKYWRQDTLKVFIDSIISFTEPWIYVVKDSHISFLQSDYMLKADNLPEILSASRIEEIKLFNCEISSCNKGKNQFIGFKENGLWGYYKYDRPGYNANINKYIEAKYYSISSMAKGSALVEYEIGKFGYIDRDGNEYFVRY